MPSQKCMAQYFMGTIVWCIILADLSANVAEYIYIPKHVVAICIYNPFIAPFIHITLMWIPLHVLHVLWI